MDAATLLRGLLAGLIATGAMLPTEIYAHRRWGLRGVLEWHEVHASLFGFQSHRPFGPAGFGVHLAFGGVAGVVIALAIRLGSLPPVPNAFASGFAMWVLTILLHERVTAVDPLRNEMGEGPAAMSLVGHLLFGAIVGLVLTGPW